MNSVRRDKITEVVLKKTQNIHYSINNVYIYNEIKLNTHTNILTIRLYESIQHLHSIFY